jgi:hypothetical protein
MASDKEPEDAEHPMLTVEEARLVMGVYEKLVARPGASIHPESWATVAAMLPEAFWN